MSTSKPNTFRKHEHLRSRKDFERLFQRRCSVSDERLIVYALPNGLNHCRLGLAVSRKIGCAVVRNRFRRLYREAFRLTKHELPTGLDLVLKPRSDQEPALLDVQQSLRKLVPEVQRK